ncbi:MAG: ABC transporter substrate-binding protein [Anaerocolumna sp.]
MKRKSSLLALLLAASLLLGACGNSAGTGKNAQGNGEAQTAATGEEGSTVQGGTGENASVLKDGKNTEIWVVFPGTSSAPASLAEVENAINEKVQKTMDATIKLKVLEWGTYTDQTNLMLYSGEKMDLFFSYSGTKDYVSKGELAPITGLIDTYGKDMLASMGKYIDACYVGDDLYGIPTYRDLAVQAGLVCRQDVLDETGIDASTVKTWDDVEKILKKVQELYPKMYPLISSEPKRGPLANINRGLFDIIQSGVGVYMNDTDGHIDVVNTYATDEYMQLAQKAAEWSKNGYFIPDSMTITDVRQDLIRAGNCFGYIGNVHPGTKTQESMNSGVDMVTIPITDRILTTQGVNFGQWTVPAVCESPEKAVAFLNILYSDPEVQNLFRYGIEGKDYVIKKDGVVGYPEGVSAQNVGWTNEAWMTGNASIGYAWETDPDQVWDKYKEYNDTATLSPLYGFIFDSSNVKNEIISIANVMDKYQGVIEAGLSDPASTVAKFNEELKAAGIQKIVDEMQSQVDAWSAQK